MAQRYDAVVLGAGFAGLYALKKLRDDLGLAVRVFDKAPDVGGTWYWNRYPGCMSDVETFTYCYSWDKQLLQEMPLSSRYTRQPELYAYFQDVARRHDLYKNIQFNTAIASAAYDAANALWQVVTDTGEQIEATYLVTAVGVLSATNMPDIAGLERFEGEAHHTSRWPAQVSFEGKRVGVIGTGSTGVQFSTAVAPLAKSLTVFQRTPQFTVPAGNRPITAEEAAAIRRDYDKIWAQARGSMLAAGFQESTVSALSVSDAEREAIFEQAWQQGGGFRFMFGTFSDLAVDERANALAQDFVRRKIAQTVTDPETARKLTPQGLYAKRPICDSGYYAMFNRPNVRLVDVKAQPIQEITAHGIRTADGEEHELDMIVFATGFDAGDGNFKRMDIRGRDGVSLRDLWKDGPSTYLGIAAQNYPNLFMVLGPNSPFTNIPPAAEVHVDWIVELIAQARARGAKQIETTKTAERGWEETCQQIGDMTLLSKVDSWIFGGNIPGKRARSYFYLGGMANYLATLEQERQTGYAGFEMR